MTLDHSWR